MASSLDRPQETPMEDEAAAAPAPAALPAETCPNCGAARSGPFCAGCGQRWPAPDDYSLRRFWRHVFHEATELDSSVVRTARGLFRPGFLTREHVAGRRAWYVSPVKLFLIISAFYFVFAWDAIFEMLNFERQLRDPNVVATMPGEIRQQYLDRLPEILERFATYTGYLRFLSVLGLGFLLALLYRRQRRALGEHFVFTLHFYSFYLGFALLTLAVLLLWRAVTGAVVPLWAYFLIGYVPVAPFAYLAMRRVYGEGRGKTAVKAALVMVFDYVIWSLVGLAAYVAAAIQVLRS